MGRMTRCMNCMQEYDSQYDMCPYCGCEREPKPRELYFLVPGTVLGSGGRYEVGVSVGDGGFGITYRAWDRTLAKTVAIKEHYPAGLVNRVPGEKDVIVYSGRREREYRIGKQRFLEEAQNMARYNTHDNIVNVYDFFEENHTAYIVMEFLEGINYREYLEEKADRGEEVPVRESLEVMHSVLTALSEVHKSDILHRDISPDNIFLCRDGRIKLIDFGAARFSAKDETVNVTVILKPGYAPPEQYQSKGRQGPWIDIYAAGATLYRAVTGQAPEESVNRTEEDGLVPPKILRPDISRGLNNAILRAMALQPELRFQSAEEFREALSGEVMVRDVGKELWLRKVRRFVSIGAISVAVMAGAAVCMDIVEQRKEAAAILDPVGITLWASTDPGEDPGEKQELLEGALESFRAEYPQVDVEVSCMDGQVYEERLRQAMEAGSLPTLFDSSCLGEEDYGALEDLSDVFRFLDTGEYYFLDHYRDFFPGRRQLPLAFSMPVAYHCTLAGTGERDVGKLVEEGDYLVTPGGYFTWYNLYGGGDPVTDFRDWAEACGEGGRVSDGAGFLGMETACLLADNTCYEWVQANLPGVYEVGFWQEKGMTGAFRDYYSMDGEATEAEKAAAVQVLVYLLADQAQDVLYVQNGQYLPLNKNVYRAYMEINGELAGLEAGIGKVQMAGEQQAPIDRWFRELEASWE